LRVIAAGLDAGRCSVVRVMTPHPDTAPPAMFVHDALKKMHNGHYLNLPVVETDGRLVAIVDVLTLTYATLEQMNAMSPEAEGSSAEAEGGPMWGRFFDSIGGEDNDSAISGSHAPTNPSIRHITDLQRSPQSEVHPDDSASAVGDDMASGVGYRHGGVMSASIMSPAPVDDGTYVFKFRTPGGQVHRFQARHDNIENLRDIVTGKLASDSFFTDMAPSDSGAVADHTDFKLSYTDADGDIVIMTSDHDVTDAVKIARAAKSDRVVLVVQGGKGWAEAGADKSAAKAAETAVAAAQEVKAVEKTEEVLPEGVNFSAPAHAHVIKEEIMGIPKDMMLPASIGALAVVIVAVFTISRITGSSSRY